MTTSMLLPQHNLDVGDAYYQHAFDRLQAIAVDYNQLLAIRPLLDQAPQLVGVDAFDAYLKGGDYLRQQGLEEIGCLLGQRFSIEAYGLFLYALLSAKDMRQALTLLGSYSPKLDYGLNFLFNADEADGVLEFLPSPNGQRFPWLLEEWLFGCWNAIKGLCPSIEAPEEIQLSMSEPAYSSLYDEVFDCPVIFSSPRNVIRLPSGCLDIKTFSQQSNIHQVLIQLLINTPALKEDDLMRSVYQRLLTEMSYHLPTQLEIAEYFSMSLATIKRRLKLAGKSYRAIVDEVRMVLAYEYLLMSSMPVKEAAYLLHYDNPANFCRAFQRWFNDSPERFRESHMPPEIKV